MARINGVSAAPDEAQRAGQRAASLVYGSFSAFLGLGSDTRGLIKWRRIWPNDDDADTFINPYSYEHNVYF